MNILVTGGTGFLGTHLMAELSKTNHNLSALVRETSDISSLRDINCELHKGDLRELGTLDKALKGKDIVFHLASLMTDDPRLNNELIETNVLGTQNILSLCKVNRVKRLIYVSSVVAVGAGQKMGEIKTENSENNTMQLQIENFETKRLAEKCVLEANSDSLETLVLNPGLIYGAGDARKSIRSGNIKVARGEQKFYIDGGVSIVAVEDVVSGLLAAMEKGRAGERYLLTGENISIKQLFEWIALEAGVTPPNKKIPTTLLLCLGWMASFFKLQGPLNYKNVKAATLWHWYNSDKAKRELGFNPRPAREAIRNSVQWMRDQGLLNSN